jgi:hypothetical protein
VTGGQFSGQYNFDFVTAVRPAYGILPAGCCGRPFRTRESSKSSCHCWVGTLELTKFLLFELFLKISVPTHNGSKSNGFCCRSGKAPGYDLSKIILPTLKLVNLKPSCNIYIRLYLSRKLILNSAYIVANLLKMNTTLS